MGPLLGLVGFFTTWGLASSGISSGTSSGALARTSLAASTTWTTSSDACASRSTCGPWASNSLPIDSAMKLSTTPESSKSTLGCGSSSTASTGSGCLWLGRLRLLLRRRDDLLLVGEAAVVVFTSVVAVDRDLFLNLPNTAPLRLPGRLPPLFVSDFFCFSSWIGGSAVSEFSTTSSCGSISLFV